MSKKSLFISNLAWDHKDFKLIKKLIKLNKFKKIDLAPIKLTGNWKKIDGVCGPISKKLLNEKIKVNAIQGIYYKKKFNLFDTQKNNFNKILRHTKKIIRLCKIFKCKKIIIGSSHFRKKGAIKKDLADEIFINFFKKFKKTLDKERIYLCLEAIPKQYKEDYIFEFYHLLSLVKKIKIKWIKINFDSSLFHFSRFDKKLFLENIRYIKNIQITQKNFKHFVNPSINNLKFCKLLKTNNSNQNISLEIISNQTNLKNLNISMKNLSKLLNY